MQAPASSSGFRPASTGVALASLTIPPEAGRDAALLFRDGRLLLRQADQLWLVSGKTKLLVGRDRLQRTAGFPITDYDLSSTDGYGRAGAIVSGADSRPLRTSLGDSWLRWQRRCGRESRSFDG